MKTFAAMNVFFVAAFAAVALLALAGCQVDPDAHYNHKWGEWRTVEAASCAESGLRERPCECGFLYVVASPLDVNAHLLMPTGSVIVAPTCMAEGYGELKCVLCGHVENGVLPVADSHNWVYLPGANEPDCLMPGSGDRECRDCREESLGGSYPALGHHWSWWVTDLAATCTDEGERSRVCERGGCGYVETETLAIDPDAHPWEYDDGAIPPTCTATGSGKRHCSLCGESENLAVIPALGHQYGEWTETIPPTCTAAAVETETCMRCLVLGTTTRAGQAAHGHDWGGSEWELINPATATEDGAEGKYCDRCGDLGETRILYALGTEGLAFELIDYDTAYRVRKGTVTSGAVHIPAYRLNAAGTVYLPVTEVGSDEDSLNGAFQGTNITAVHFLAPSRVAVIGNYAFYGCIDLMSFTIPDSVTSIGERVFEGCNALQSITIPFVGEKTDGTGLTHFGWLFGASDNNGQNSYIPASLKTVVVTGSNSILNNAFQYCSGLTSVTIPNSVTSIGDYAFAYCTGLTSITIPNSVTSIGWGAFWGCTGLTSITIPNSVTSTGDYAFYGCTGLTSITIPNSVTSIGNGAFQYCSGLTSVTIPDSVTSIGVWAFAYCTGLTSITIPNSVTSIGAIAFAYCTGLTSVTIPNSVTSIGSGAFNECTNLVSITIPFVGEKADGTGQTHFGWLFGASDHNGQHASIPPSLKTVVVSGGDIADDAFYQCDNLETITIGNGVTSIGNRAFRYCNKMKSITIGNGVTSIGEYAFNGCNDLASVTILPGSTAIIGKEAFRYCSNLVNLTIGNGVLSIGENAFNGTGVKIVTIPDSVIAIGDYAFDNCKSMESVTIGNGVESIGVGAFSYADNLISVTIGNGPMSIGNYAFLWCESLESVTIGNGVTSIGVGAFSNTGLTNVTIPNSVTSIGTGAFSNTGLTSITIPFVGETYNNGTSDTHFGWLFGASDVWSQNSYIPASLKTVEVTGGDSIPNNAFRGCSGLTSVTIPNSVTIIGTGAFSNTGLTNVTIPNSVTDIGAGAFDNCSNLTSVTIGANVTSIGAYAFQSCSSLTSFIVRATTPPALGTVVFTGAHDDLSIKVPAGSVAAYQSAANWSEYASRISAIVE